MRCSQERFGLQSRKVEWHYQQGVGDSISADSGQERGNAGASGKLSSAELVDGLDTRLAVCHDARAVF